MSIQISFYLFIVTVLANVQLFAQSKTTVVFKGGFNQTLFSLNKQDKTYDKSWEELNLKYKDNTGYTVSLGFNRTFSKKNSIGVDVRHTKWRGEIFAIKDKPTFYQNLLIDYKSLSIPVFANINLLNKGKSNFTAKIGLGFDYTYYTTYKAVGYYGQSRTQYFHIDQYAKFLLLGLTYQLKVNNNVSIIFDAEINTDYYLGNTRNHNFMDFYSHPTIPLYYTLFILQSGVKIKL